MKRLPAVFLAFALAALALGHAFAAPKTIYVGTQNDYPPFAYLDEKGALVGYDIDIMKEIGKLLPEYDFQFVVGGWDGIFLSLEANRTQIIDDEIGKSPEREQKYLYAEEGSFSAQSVIIVRKDSKVASLKDLEGQTVIATTGDLYTQILETYNASNGNKIKLKYTDSAPLPSIFQDIEAGRADAYVNDPIMAKAVIKANGFKNLRIVKDPIRTRNVYFVYRKDDLGHELQTKIDAALRKLKADGTLSRLSTQWTDGDYIPR